jgi:hypothetical protein
MIGAMYNTRLFSPLLLVLVAIGLLGLGGCTDVGVNPKSSATANNVFSEDGAYQSYLAKLYGGLNVTGQEGPAGDADIGAIDDEGFSQYMRLYWKMQELSTDEAVIAWNDNGIRRLNNHNWTASNQFSVGMYSRVFFQVSQANEFLRQSTDDRLNNRGVGAERQQQIQQYRAEARFLRALSYWHGIDLFGDIPLVTEDFPRGAEAPEQSTREEIFNFVESELKAITNPENEEVLPPAGQAEYGRADRAAAWMVLAKLYQNAPVYIGENRSADVVEYTGRVIDAGYSLEDNYQHLFLADNHTANGIIFAIPQDGDRTRHYGGTTFLAHAPVGNEMDPANFGLDFGWVGLRTTSASVDRYTSGDSRDDFFFTQGQEKEIDATLPNGETTDDPIGAFSQGYAAPKFQNVTSDGQPGSNVTFPDTDYPMFRLADAYLMYAEATLRSDAGDESRALSLLNDLRERAGLGRDLSQSDLTLDFILDERSRELFWEAHRRTDLIRFNQFTENGTWPWKGGVQEGTTTESFRNVYPIPASELRANPNLEQNDGY